MTREHLTLEEAERRIMKIRKRRFGDFGVPVPNDAVTAKGRFGSLLEEYIGLNPLSNKSDFLDGELKTNMTYADGRPKETIFICQIGNLLKGDGGLLGPTPTPFEESYLYAKVRNMLIVPVVKVDLPPEEWYVDNVYHVIADRQSNPHLFAKFKEDYESICSQNRMALKISVNAMIHTTNGPHYIQIRTKDGIPSTYKPMYCPHFKRDISNKRFAFYFTKKLVNDFRRGDLSI